MRFEFHSEALEEYEQAALWHADREPALAVRFIASVEDAIRRVLEAPTRWRVMRKMFVAVSLTCSRTEFSIPSKMISCLSSLLCIVAGSLATGSSASRSGRKFIPTGDR
jgi:plasmid stabilization system protein ParE